MPQDAAPPAAGVLGHARVAILTIINEEFDAVREVFGADHEVEMTGFYSPVGASEAAAGGRVVYPFVLAQSPERSNTPAGELPRELARLFRPEVFVVVGIAGGVLRRSGTGAAAHWRGRAPGDVVVASYVHYGEYAKHLDDRSYRRYFALDHPAPHLVTTHGRAVHRTRNGPPWHAAIRAERPGPGTPVVEEGEILAVEGIAGAPDRAAQAEMLRSFDNAIAVDMESMGVARALHVLRSSLHYNPTWMCVRGISDRVYVSDPESGPAEENRDAGDNDSQRAAWKPYAAEAAAVYAKCVVARILATERPPVPADSGTSAWSFPERAGDRSVGA